MIWVIPEYTLLYSIRYTVKAIWEHLFKTESLYSSRFYFVIKNNYITFMMIRQYFSGAFLSVSGICSRIAKNTVFEHYQSENLPLSELNLKISSNYYKRYSRKNKNFWGIVCVKILPQNQNMNFQGHLKRFLHNKVSWFFQTKAQKKPGGHCTKM